MKYKIAKASFHLIYFKIFLFLFYGKQSRLFSKMNYLNNKLAKTSNMV